MSKARLKRLERPKGSWRDRLLRTGIVPAVFFEALVERVGQLQGAPVREPSPYAEATEAADVDDWTPPGGFLHPEATAPLPPGRAPEPEGMPDAPEARPESSRLDESPEVVPAGPGHPQTAEGVARCRKGKHQLCVDCVRYWDGVDASLRAQDEERAENIRGLEIEATVPESDHVRAFRRLREIDRETERHLASSAGAFDRFELSANKLRRDLS